MDRGFSVEDLKLSCVLYIAGLHVGLSIVINVYRRVNMPIYVADMLLWLLQILVSHNRSRLAEFFVGSVSSYVVKNCASVCVLLH